MTESYCGLHLVARDPDYDNYETTKMMANDDLTTAAMAIAATVKPLQRRRPQHDNQDRNNKSRKRFEDNNRCNNGTVISG